MGEYTRAELERFTVAEAAALEKHTRTPFHLLLAGAPVRCGQCHDQPPWSPARFSYSPGGPLDRAG